MKLNTKRTVCVGFAFFLICTFWQAYDTIIPKILTDRFGMSQTWSGLIMALDNIFALFMLPLFGVISDKCRSKMGRRTPFILIGTVVASVTLICMSFVDAAQLKKIEAVSGTNSKDAYVLLYNYGFSGRLTSPAGEEYTLKEVFVSEEDIKAVEAMDDNGKATDAYTNYIVPARQAYIREEITGKDPSNLIVFIAVLLILLVSMATFRTPAVALMPDVTVKPLRSKANAIINLMGTVGGSIVLALGMIFATGSTENTFMSYTGYFCTVAGIMLVCLAVFMATVREKKFVSDMEKQSRELGIDDGEDDGGEGSRRLSKGELTSLILILASVVLWYLGYNAVTSKYSVYAGNILGLDYNSTLLVANVAALIAFIPVGIVASRIGRKKTIIAGVVMLAGSFGVAAFLDNGTPLPVMMIIFALAGIGWASINVNSFPMVVELARGGKVGTYTGYYYTASMAAQTVTPIFSGFLMDKFGMRILFPYAAVFAGCAIITMFFVKHGDSKPSAAQIAKDAADNA